MEKFTMPQSETPFCDEYDEATAARLDEERKTAGLIHQHLMNSAFKHGEASGFAKGYLSEVALWLDKAALGEDDYNAELAHAHREVINRVCQILGIMVTIPRLEQLNAMDLHQLIQLKDELIRSGCWQELIYKKGEDRGEAKDRAIGKAEGKLESLQSAVHRLCRIFGIDVDAARMAELAGLDEQGLTALLDTLETERSWPKSELR